MFCSPGTRDYPASRFRCCQLVVALFSLFEQHDIGARELQWKSHTKVADEKGKEYMAIFVCRPIVVNLGSMTVFLLPQTKFTIEDCKTVGVVKLGGLCVVFSSAFKSLERLC